MKTTELNSLTCTITYQSHGDVMECTIECVSDGQRWHGYARSKPSARVSAIETMTAALRDGYTCTV